MQEIDPVLKYRHSQKFTGDWGKAFSAGIIMKYQIFSGVKVYKI
jgi:hypothetical protein